jgi:hypothetical protein
MNINNLSKEERLRRANLAMAKAAKVTGLPYTASRFIELAGQKQIFKCECGEPVYDEAADGKSYCMTCLQTMDEREMEEKRRERAEVVWEGER